MFTGKTSNGKIYSDHRYRKVFDRIQLKWTKAYRGK